MQTLGAAALDRPADGERQAHRDRSFAARRMRGSSQRLRRPRPGPTEEPSSPPNGYLLGPLMGPPRCPWVTRLFRIGGKHRGVGRMTSVAMVFGCQGRYWAEKSFALGLAWATQLGRACRPALGVRCPCRTPHALGLVGFFSSAVLGIVMASEGRSPATSGFSICAGQRFRICLWNSGSALQSVAPVWTLEKPPRGRRETSGRCTSLAPPALAEPVPTPQEGTASLIGAAAAMTCSTRGPSHGLSLSF